MLDDVTKLANKFTGLGWRELAFPREKDGKGCDVPQPSGQRHERHILDGVDEPKRLLDLGRRDRGAASNLHAALRQTHAAFEKAPRELGRALALVVRQELRRKGGSVHLVPDLIDPARLLLDPLLEIKSPSAALMSFAS